MAAVIGDGRRAMLDRNKHFMSRPKFAGVLIAAILLVPLAASSVTSAENDSASKVTLPALDVPQRRLNVVKSAPLVDQGVTLGTVVIYDDPSTPRPEDYLEVYNPEGNLVVVAWFDRFGIQRVAVDRAFVEGEDQLEGVLVAVVDDNFI
jgi:hypothetical protein